MSKIAFQGNPGAYSDLACRTAFPEMETLPCSSFDVAFNAVQTGEAELAMIPIDNIIAGRVADIHHLLPESDLHIVGEHFEPVHHCLLGVKGATLDDLKTVYSHVHALPQCRRVISELGLEKVVHGDTAASAGKVAEMGDKTCCAIASELAAEIYGLDILKRNVEDREGNTTRFIVLAQEPSIPEFLHGHHYVTSFIFRVRNIPAALYKGLGGFATNGLNITKLESYLVDGKFTSAQFFSEVEGHPEDRPLRLALDELGFFAREFKFLGTYPAHPYRMEQSGEADEPDPQDADSDDDADENAASA